MVAVAPRVGPAFRRRALDAAAHRGSTSQRTLQRAGEMPVVERDDVVEKLAPKRSEEAYDEGILPRVSVGSSNLLDAAGIQERSAVTPSPKIRSLSRNMKGGRRSYGIARMVQIFERT